MATEISSILDSVKKKIGLDPEEITEFDPDLIDAINTFLSVLTELGIGPDEGFKIHDNSTTWEDFVGDCPKLDMVRSYVFIRTRLIFDPPQNSYLITHLKDEAKELEWRLNVAVESPESYPIP